MSAPSEPPSPTSTAAGHGGFSSARILAAATVGLGAAGALLDTLAYWPGIFTWDPMRQYDQALSGQFDDWHPPAMGWIWRQLAAVVPGPGPMLLIQLLLYWTGITLVALWAVRQGHRRTAAALALCGWLPLSLALMGAILKDCLMAGCLTAATGLWLWSRSSGVAAGRARLCRIVAAALLLYASALRFNAAAACLPLLVVLLPQTLRATPLRLVLASLAALALLVAAMPVANRLIGAERSGVELSLVIFDLGGIGAHSGENMFPPLDVADPVAVNRHCYKPVKWDSYSDWVDPECPLGWTAFRDWLDEDPRRSPYPWWLRAVLRHPLAYAAHRAAHFNINSRFLIHDQVERPVPVASVPNEWHFTVTPNPALRTVDAAARASAATPLGWPIVWIALALGLVMLAPALPSVQAVLPLALSSFLYGAGYFVVSVSSELRYHLWTWIAAALAAVIAAGDLARMPARPWRRALFCAAPALLTVLLGTAWRLA